MNLKTNSDPTYPGCRSARFGKRNRDGASRLWRRLERAIGYLKRLHGKNRPSGVRARFPGAHLRNRTWRLRPTCFVAAKTSRDGDRHSNCRAHRTARHACPRWCGRFGHGVRTDSVLHRWQSCTNITKTDPNIERKGLNVVAPPGSAGHTATPRKAEVPTKIRQPQALARGAGAHVTELQS